MKNSLAVNCSILLKDRPIPERLRAVGVPGSGDLTHFDFETWKDLA